MEKIVLALFAGLALAATAVALPKDVCSDCTDSVGKLNG